MEQKLNTVVHFKQTPLSFNLSLDKSLSGESSEGTRRIKQERGGKKKKERTRRNDKENEEDAMKLEYVLQDT